MSKETKSQKEISELRDQISSLTRKLDILEQKEKSKKGVLNHGEWLLVEADVWDDWEEKATTKQTTLFLNNCDTIIPINCYMDVESAYISDILEDVRHIHHFAVKKLTHRKISVEEAIPYMKG